MKNNTVIVIVGPTASGKTSLSVEIAKKLGGEIISADSMQIYKGMDIATAKPTDEEKCGVEHHLMDFLDPEDEFSVAKYKELAVSKIEELLNKGKIPIIVGGTGLYVDTVINNTVFFNYDDSETRERLEKECDENGIEALFHKLKEVDPDTAEKLHLNDKKRIIRALEVYYLTGKTITEQNNESHKEKSKFNFIQIGLNAKNRDYLYDRINKRVDLMLESGLLDEAKMFYSSDYSSTAKQAIGYKELLPYLKGFVTLDDAVEKLKQETRRYAKRQLTWFRKNNDINWIFIDENNNIVSECLKIIKRQEAAICEEV